jgi:hypothetical protein
MKLHINPKIKAGLYLNRAKLLLIDLDVYTHSQLLEQLNQFQKQHLYGVHLQQGLTMDKFQDGPLVPAMQGQG